MRSSQNNKGYTDSYFYQFQRVLNLSICGYMKKKMYHFNLNYNLHYLLCIFEKVQTF
jgi:hypothetical protein